MKTRLKCICIGCGDEERLTWYEAWGKKNPIKYRLYLCGKCIRFIELHKTAKWHLEYKASLYRRKYFWRKGGVGRWLKNNGIELPPEPRGFVKSIKEIIKHLRRKK